MFYGQVGVPWGLEGSSLIISWETLSEESVLAEYDEGAVLLSQSGGHETRILIEIPYGTFISAVEKDWLGLDLIALIRLPEILIVDDVSNVEGC